MLNFHQFVSDSSLFKKFKLDDLIFVEYECVLNKKRTGYWTHCNYLVYAICGKKIWRSMDKEFVAEPGDAFFLKKGTYIVEQFGKEKFCSLLIFFPDDFIRSTMKNWQLRNPGKKVKNEHSILPVNVNDVLHSYFQSILSYFPQQQPPSDCQLRVKFEEFIINILSNTNNSSLASYFDQICMSDKISISEVMEANFSSKMNLEEFAKLSDRSLSTFQRDFKKEFKTSPSRWLIQKRLQFARFLLETTSLSVGEVAFESGFESSSHFIRVFKEKYKNTPLRFKHSVENI